MRKIIFLLLLIVCGFCYCNENIMDCFIENETWDTYKLFDIGVCDFNLDGNLDFFTSNHNALQMILEGDGQGGFSDSLLSTLELDQDKDFPGLEVTTKYPVFLSDGLYIFWNEFNLCVFLFSDEEYYINLEFISETEIIKNTFVSTITETILPTGLKQTYIELSNQNDAELIINPYYKAMKISIDTNVEKENIYVGLKQINPNNHQFSIQLQDRHGIAWCDHDRDFDVDLFISRGGMKGDISLFTGNYNYELYSSIYGPYSNIISETGININGSRGRQVAWVDYNNDHFTDLFCGNLDTENQLFKNSPTGIFTDVAPDLFIDQNKTGKFKWFDHGRDNDMDLVIINTKGFIFWENEESVFTKNIIYENNVENYNAYNMTIADFDNDYDLDIFCSSMDGNYIIRDDGVLTKIDPDFYNLPGNSKNAIFVDVDNDGLMDIDFSGIGVYKQGNDGKYGVYTEELTNKYSVPLSVWADINNDGYRDCFLAYNTGDQKWKIDSYINNISANNWIEMDFASYSTGTKVTVIAGNDVYYAEVGMFEDSKYSQGNYRLYFGLKDKTIIDSIEIERLDGQIFEYKNVNVNQRLWLLYI